MISAQTHRGQICCAEQECLSCAWSILSTWKPVLWLMPDPSTTPLWKNGAKHVFLSLRWVCPWVFVCWWEICGGSNSSLPLKGARITRTDGAAGVLSLALLGSRWQHVVSCSHCTAESSGISAVDVGIFLLQDLWRQYMGIPVSASVVWRSCFQFI